MLVTVNMFEDDLIIQPTQLVLGLRTTQSEEQVSIPTADFGMFSATINWGDETEVLTIDSYDSPNLTHTYSSPGEHEVEILGSFPNVYHSETDTSHEPLVQVVDGGKFTKLDHGFNQCANLISLAPNMDVSDVTDFSNAWSLCDSLAEFPLLNTSNGVNFNSAWSSCNSLTSFPEIPTSNGINFEASWSNCSSLTEFPLLDVSNGTNFLGAWYNCNSLTEFPLLDVSNGTTFSNAWGNCLSLTSFPELNLSKSTDFSQTWSACKALTSFPAIDISSGVNFSYAWDACESLTEFPLLEVPNGVDFSNAWWRCRDLIFFPLMLFPNGVNFSGAWSNVDSLTSFPALDLSNGVDFGTTWYYAPSLVTFPSVTFVNAKSFVMAWGDCHALENFPPNMFDNLTGQMEERCFHDSWIRCKLTTQSIENILVSIDTASITPFSSDSASIANRISISKKFGESLTETTLIAIDSLISKNWNVEIDGEISTGTDLGDELTLTFRTTTANELIAIPCGSWAGPFDAVINWREGHSVSISSNTDPGLSHYFPSSGDHDVEIIGSFPRIFFDYNSVASKLVRVDGGVFIYLDNAFRGCRNLESVSPNMDVSQVTNFNNAWAWCSALTEFPPLDMSNATNLRYAWHMCMDLASFPSMDFSNVIDFDAAWGSCYDLVEFPFLNLINARSFNGTWGMCTSLQHFPSNMFDNLTGVMPSNCFNGTWDSCKLTAQSVENILVSIDTSGILPTTTTGNYVRDIRIDTGEGETLTNDTLTAITSLKSKNWIIKINGDYPI